MASSKTVFRPRWVRAEHSRYFTESGEGDGRGLSPGWEALLTTPPRPPGWELPGGSSVGSSPRGASGRCVTLGRAWASLCTLTYTAATGRPLGPAPGCKSPRKSEAPVPPPPARSPDSVLGIVPTCRGKLRPAEGHRSPQVTGWTLPSAQGCSRRTASSGGHSGQRLCSQRLSPLPGQCSLTFQKAPACPLQPRGFPFGGLGRAGRGPTVH